MDNRLKDIHFVEMGEYEKRTGFETKNMTKLGNFLSNDLNNRLNVVCTILNVMEENCLSCSNIEKCLSREEICAKRRYNNV